MTALYFLAMEDISATRLDPGEPASPVRSWEGWLMRTRATPMQGHLNPGLRKKNVKNAFGVRAASAVHVQGKNILLIDDVYTTGATVSAVTRALKFL